MKNNIPNLIDDLQEILEAKELLDEILSYYDTCGNKFDNEQIQKNDENNEKKGYYNDTLNSKIRYYLKSNNSK